VGRAAAPAARLVLPVLGLLLVCLMLPGLAGAKSAEWQTYISDDFSGPSAFFSGQMGEALYSIDKGHYVIDGKHATQDSLSALTDNLYYYYVEAQCRVLETAAGELAFTGIVFHYTKVLEKSRAYYVFYIYGDGYYGAKRVVGDEVQIVIPLSRSADIDPTGPNVLAVDAQGTRFDLYINGKYVNGFTDVRIDGGGFGLYVSKQTVGVFDNFKVKIEKRGGGNDGPGFPESVDDNGGADSKYPKLDIPKDPNRPTYPWEVGVRKHKGKRGEPEEDHTPPKHDKDQGGARQGNEGGGQDSGGSEQPPPVDEPGDVNTARAAPDPALIGTRHPAFDTPPAPATPAPNGGFDSRPAPDPAPTVYEEPVKSPPAKPAPTKAAPKSANPGKFAATAPDKAKTKPAAKSGKSSKTPKTSVPAGKPAATGKAAPAKAPPPSKPVPVKPPQNTAADESTVLLMPSESIQADHAPTEDQAPDSHTPDAVEQQEPAAKPRLASSRGLSLTDLGQAANSAIVPEAAPSSARPTAQEPPAASTPPLEKPQKRIKVVKADRPKEPAAQEPPAAKEPKPKPPKQPKPVKEPKVKPPPAPGDGSADKEPALSEHERLAQAMRPRGLDDGPEPAPAVTRKPATKTAPQDAAATGEGVQLPTFDSAAPATAPKTPRPAEPQPAAEPAPVKQPKAAPPIVTGKAPPKSDQPWENASEPDIAATPAAPDEPPATEPAAPSAAVDLLPAAAAPPTLLRPDDNANAASPVAPQPAAASPEKSHDPTAIPLPPQLADPQLGALQPAQHGPAIGPSVDSDAFTGRPGLVRLTDDFSHPRWPVSQNQGSIYRYANGGYEIDNLKAQSMAISYQDERLGEMRVDCTCDFLDGSNYVGYGCAIRFAVGSDGQVSYYGMFVSKAGECLLLKVAGGQEQVLADWKACSGYRPGQPNTLRLEAIGGSLRAYVNGVPAQSAREDSLGPGGYALLAGPGVKVRYTSLGLAGLHPSGN
jgi:hypothetical protein